MGKRGVFLFLLLALWLAMSAGTWGQDAKETLNLAAGTAQHKTHETFKAAKENTDSWVDRTFDKIAEGLGFGQENAKEKAKNMGDKAGDAASVATERLRMSTFGSSDTDSVHDNFDPSIRMPTDTIDNAKETVTRAMGSGMDRAANAYDEANNTMNRATGAASDKAYDAMEYGKDRTANAYDGAKEGVNMASNKDYDAKETVRGAMGSGMDRAGFMLKEQGLSVHSATSKPPHINWQGT
ncbi:late embryogenesis abundant protein D-29 isoform X2 [Prunus persica]|uniref:late embryogenesis abundant protein D-29 isoform X2 n=1 Tax=Prunus persica TaxID=3760 RepID=UPI0009ABA20A|nr:late embryogenesis abundant protein D-29 isoform X2 [Prunus persica]